MPNWSDYNQNYNNAPNGAKQRELRLLIDNLTSKGDIESEHLFQAALSLSRELYGLAGHRV